MSISISRSFLVAVVVCAVTGCASTDNTVSDGAPLTPLEAARTKAAENPENVQAQYEYGNALFDAERFVQASSTYLDVIARDPNHASAYNNLGLCYRALGDLAGALDAYEKALALTPDDATVLQNYAIALEAAGETDRLLPVQRRLADLRPEDVQVLSNLGRTLLRLERYKEAIPVYRRVLELDPGLAGDYHNLGLAYYLTEDWDAALTAWLSALAYDRENPSVLKGLAAVYWKRAEYARAWEAVAECQKRGIPLDPQFVSALQRDSGQTGPE